MPGRKNVVVEEELQAKLKELTVELQKGKEKAKEKYEEVLKKKVKEMNKKLEERDLVIVGQKEVFENYRADAEEVLGVWKAQNAEREDGKKTVKELEKKLVEEKRIRKEAEVELRAATKKANVERAKLEKAVEKEKQQLKKDHKKTLDAVEKKLNEEHAVTREALREVKNLEKKVQSEKAKIDRAKSIAKSGVKDLRQHSLRAADITIPKAPAMDFSSLKRKAVEAAATPPPASPESEPLLDNDDKASSIFVTTRRKRRRVAPSAMKIFKTPTPDGKRREAKSRQRQPDFEQSTVIGGGGAALGARMRSRVPVVDTPEVGTVGRAPLSENRSVLNMMPSPVPSKVTIVRKGRQGGCGGGDRLAGERPAVPLPTARAAKRVLDFDIHFSPLKLSDAF